MSKQNESFDQEAQNALDELANPPSPVAPVSHERGRVVADDNGRTQHLRHSLNYLTAQVEFDPQP